MPPITLAIPAALAVLAASPLLAQDQPPAHWRWVTDAPARVSNASGPLPDSSFAFAEMPPGWHVTMGPGGVLFDPRYFAEGTYTIETKIFHFPNSAKSEYGIMVGGRDLEGPGARYVAFVLRGDGSVAAWEQAGGERRTLSDWKRAEAVLASDGKEVVGNLLKLSVSNTEAVLRANGLDVLILPLDGRSLGGQVGFRVGKGVNLHASTYTLSVRLAPAPRGR